MTEGDLARIYASIPTGATCEGCHECAIRCSGAIRVAECEWTAIERHASEHISPDVLARLLREDKTFEIADGIVERFCILYDMQSRGCAVYPVRPLVCRLLGHVEFMPCPVERVPSVLPDAHSLMVAYAGMGLRAFSEWLAERPSSALAKALGDGKEGCLCP